MKIKILYVGDVGVELNKLIEPSTILERTGFDSDAPTLEFAFYEHVAKRNLIRKAIDAEHNGYNAIVIGCFYDTGLEVLRELLDIPVIGICEASVHIASMLTAGKFSILIGRRKWMPKMAENVRKYGLESRTASWRIVNLSLGHMEDHSVRDRTKEVILKEAKKAVEEDMAEVIILGCTELAGLSKEIQDELGVPVLDPVTIGIKVAELRATLWERYGISHSKIGGHEKPPIDELESILKNFK